jgi:hypothetical protein
MMKRHPYPPPGTTPTRHARRGGLESPGVLPSWPGNVRTVRAGVFAYSAALLNRGPHIAGKTGVTMGRQYAKCAGATSWRA